MSKTKQLKDLVLAIVPEGPIAHDGAVYRYSKGERKYIDGLAPFFREVVIVAFVFRPGDTFYEACSHSPFTAPNVRVVELPKSSEQPSILEKVWQFTKVTGKILLEIPRLDVLYLFVPSYPSAIAWIFGRLWRRPHFVYAADDWETATDGMFKWEKSQQSLLYRIFGSANRYFERRIAQTALFSVTAGQQLLEKYRRFCRKVYETTPRMTLSPTDMYPREDTCQGDVIRIINVGHLVHDKAQHILLSAVANLAERHTTLLLDILGEGPRAEELKDLIRKLGIDNRVSFHGHIQDEADLNAFYRRSDIFVLSSVSEGFPRVLYEAMAMHLPIVTTNVGGVSRLMKDNYNARVVETNNVSALAEAIESVLTDGQQRRKLIANGAMTIQSVFDRMNPKQIPMLLEQYLTSSSSR